MKTYICCDGLGGKPEVTFAYFKNFMEPKGHKVILVNTSKVRTHEERVQAVMESHFPLRFGLAKNDQIYLVGQSAGGSAVRIAAERLSKNGASLGGVILLSPAMPRNIFFMTWTLFIVMGLKIFSFLFAKEINLSDSEYEKLVAPLPQDQMAQVVKNRAPISGPEARTLAFCPEIFQGYSYRTLHIYGECDKWISPSSQRKLGKMLAMNSKVATFVVPQIGHLTLSSNRREKVMKVIQEWVHDKK